MNERQKINFERIANGEPLLPPVNQQEMMQVKLNERINESRDNNLEIANVEMTCDALNFNESFFPECYDRSGGTSCMHVLYFGEIRSGIVKMPLYKGLLDLYLQKEMPISVTGSGDIDIVEDDDYYELFITGDCSITITSAGADEE